MLPFLERVKTWWSTADQKQKVVTLGGIGALLLVLLGTAVVVTRPHYETLFDGLSETDKADIVETLKATGEFNPQIGRPGAIELPQEQIPAARMKIALANKLPKSVKHWTADKILSAGLMISKEQSDVLQKTVIEGEIASSLETMQGVATANVLITMPEKRLFETHQNHPTASVSIVESGEGALSPANGRTIANLVCSAVDNMTTADVVVVTNSLGELWNGHDGNVARNKSEQDNKVAKDFESKLQSALDFTMGPGNTKVLVRADVDNATHTIHDSKEVTGPKPKTVISTKESMDRASKPAGGPAGTDSNTVDRAPATPPANGNGGNYSNSGSQKDFPTSTLVEDTVDEGGGLKGLAISVIANSDKVPDDSKVKSVIDGVMGGLIQKDANGAPLINQAFTTTVTSFKFDGSSAQAAKDVADRLASQQRTQQIMSLLPIAAILAVALLVAKQVGKISRAVLPAPMSSEASMAEETMALADGETFDALTASGSPALPSASGMNGSMMGLNGSTTGLNGSVMGPNGEVVENFSALLPETIRDRIDLPLESLKQIANERPEMLATLIKSVLLGERG